MGSGDQIMNRDCPATDRVLIYDGSADDLRRLAMLLERAATAEATADVLTVASPEAAEGMVRKLLSGLCMTYAHECDADDAGDAAAAGGAGKGLYKRMLRLMDEVVIEAALRKTGGCQVRAAEILGINRNTLRSRMQQLGILGSSF